MAPASTQIPWGFHFRPTEEELSHFLIKKKAAEGSLVPCDRIVEINLYGEDATPWQILTKDKPWNDSKNPKKKEIFVFTKLSKGIFKNKNSRRAGCGTWDGKSVPKAVKNSQGKIIGTKKTFTFKHKKGDKREIIENGRWTMQEISMEKYDYVICKITKEEDSFPSFADSLENIELLP